MENSSSTVFIDSGVRLGFGEQLPSANAPHFSYSIHVSMMQDRKEDDASRSMHAPVELTKLTNDNELQTQHAASVTKPTKHCFVGFSRVFK